MAISTPTLSLRWMAIQAPWNANATRDPRLLAPNTDIAPVTAPSIKNQYVRRRTRGFTNRASSNAMGANMSISEEKSEELLKYPGGPKRPQPVKPKPRAAHVRAPKNDILKLASRKMTRNMKYRSGVVTILMTRK